MSDPVFDVVDEKRQTKKIRWRIKGKGCSGCPGTDDPWTMAIAILTLCIAILAIITVAISLFRTSNADSVVRFSIEATPARVDPGPGEGNRSMTGMFILNSKRFTIEYDFFTPPGLSAVQSLLVRGPVAAGMTDGPVAFSLCGAPNMVTVCDTLSEPGRIKGTITQVEPGGTAVNPQIDAIRKDPTRYYLEVWTGANPTSPGALRAPFYGIVATEL